MFSNAFLNKEFFCSHFILFTRQTYIISISNTYFLKLQFYFIKNPDLHYKILNIGTVKSIYNDLKEAVMIFFETFIYIFFTSNIGMLNNQSQTQSEITLNSFLICRFSSFLLTLLLQKLQAEYRNYRFFILT